MRNPNNKERLKVDALLCDEEEADALFNLQLKKMHRKYLAPAGSELQPDGSWSNGGDKVANGDLEAIAKLFENVGYLSAERRAALAVLRKRCGMSFGAKLDPSGWRWKDAEGAELVKK